MEDIEKNYFILNFNLYLSAINYKCQKDNSF